MIVLQPFDRYADAEGYADQYRGDVQPADQVHVVEDFLPDVAHRFLAVLGDVDPAVLWDGDPRYEIQYTT